MDATQGSDFLVLYDTHYETILRYLLRRCGEVTLAYDLTSETFFKALKAFPTYKAQPEKPALAWLYRIALNELRMYWRKQQRYQFEAIESYPELRSTQPNAEHLAMAAQDAEYVREAIQTLNEVDRNLVSLRYFGELSLEEIVDVTGLKLGTVKSRLSRAMKKLAAVLQPFVIERINHSVRPDAQF